MITIEVFTKCIIDSISQYFKWCQMGLSDDLFSADKIHFLFMSIGQDCRISVIRISKTCILIDRSSISRGELECHLDLYER